jgi:alkylation response protein AidB-like acyl-CoA dehydrogenase
MMHQWLVGRFALEAQQEVWAEAGTIVAGCYPPAGKCEVVAGGYRISGKWPFASNCDNAGWYILGVMAPAQPAGTSRPEWTFLLVPASQTEIEDTWFAAGLSGTGSKTIVIKEEVFVPQHRAQIVGDPAPAGSRIHANAVYRMPFFASIPIAIGSPALGIVQGAIDQFVEWTRGRLTRRGTTAQPMAELPHVQSRVAEAAAALDAARLLLERGLRETELRVAGGEAISVELRVRNRRDQAYAVKLAVNAIDALFGVVGAHGLFLSSGVQRAWRDVHAIGHHIAFNWDGVSAMYGQQQFGLEPTASFY